MSVTLNTVGSSALDSIVQGAPFKWVIRPSSLDVATVTDAWIDTSAGFPGTNSIKSSLSPAATVTTRGTGGTYTHSNRRLVIGSTTGLTAGDSIEVSHGSITQSAAEIESIFDATTVVLLTATNPFTADASSVSFEVCWTYSATAGTAPSTSSGVGQQNFFKAQLADSAGNATQFTESHYVKNIPAGALLAAIAGFAYNGSATTNDSTPTLSLLSSFGANNGGVTYVGLANHGTQSVNNAQWGDTTTTEKTFANAISLGLTFTGGDGIKYGRLVLQTKSGSSNVVTNIDWAITLDTTGPSIVYAVYPR